MRLPGVLVAHSCNGRTDLSRRCRWAGSARPLGAIILRHDPPGAGRSETISAAARKVVLGHLGVAGDRRTAEALEDRARRSAGPRSLRVRFGPDRVFENALRGRILICCRVGGPPVPRRGMDRSVRSLSPAADAMQACAAGRRASGAGWRRRCSRRPPGNPDPCGGKLSTYKPDNPSCRTLVPGPVCLTRGMRSGFLTISPVRSAPVAAPMMRARRGESRWHERKSTPTPTGQSGVVGL